MEKPSRAEGREAVAGVEKVKIEQTMSFLPPDPDYLKASTVDDAPLSQNEVENYFSKFGPLKWCMQADDVSTVAFRFRDPALTEIALGFNHCLVKKSIRLIAVK